MAHAGYFDKKELMTLRRLGSRLQGHPERTRLPGMETTSGPLGCGLSQACGAALALRMDNQLHRWVYVVMGDGELDEGNIWEAAMLAGKEKLGNVIGIIDRNNIQIDGPTELIMPLEDLKAKWEAFGWHVLEIKVQKIRDHHPEAEIGWDGGINDHNAKQLVEAGVDVLNVGGYIQQATKPADAYATPKALV